MLSTLTIYIPSIIQMKLNGNWIELPPDRWKFKSTALPIFKKINNIIKIIHTLTKNKRGCLIG